LYLFVFVGVFRTLQDFLSVYLLTDLAFFLAMDILIQATTLYCLTRSSTREVLAVIA
jgi:hypothetical protein